jgi:hypothetical protein
MLWEATYDDIQTLDRRSAVNLLMRAARQCRANERRRLRSSEARKTRKELATQVAFTWLRRLLQQRMQVADLQSKFGNVSDLDMLLDRLHDGGRHERNRSLAVLGSLRG